MAFQTVAHKLKKILGAKESSILYALVFLFAILSFSASGFMSTDNFLNIGRQVAVIGIMSAGLAIVLISGNIDLSIGSIYGLSAVVCAIVLRDTQSTTLAIVAGLLIGIIFGSINGFLVVKVGVPSFIATFGMMYVARGVALIITNSYPISLMVEGIDRDTHKFFYFIGQGLLFGVIPMQFVFMILVMIVCAYILHKKIFGIHVFAVGGSEKASFVSGINVKMVRFKTFVLSGVLAALAGVLSLSFIGSVIPTAGQGLEFEVFAAVIIGGTSMAGGEGSILGVFIGVLIFGIIRNGLILLGVGPFWQVLIIGVITICAVIYDSIRRNNQLKREV